MWRVIALALCLLSSSAFAGSFNSFQTNGTNTGGGGGGGTFTPAWQSLSIGGGGLMNNVQVSQSDGTLVTSANTYGAYLLRTTGTCLGAASGGWGTTRNAPCMEQLFTQTSAPLTLTQITQLNQGVLEIDACNNNTNDAYAFYNGNLWVTTTLKSAPASRTWAQTPLTNAIAGNQGANAGTGPTIGCDPANPNIVYAGVPGNLKVSFNGLSGASASFANVSGVGTTGTLPSLIVFDPTSSTQSCTQFSGSPTCTKHFLVFTDGTGVEETYNGGSSFTLTSSGPTTGSGGCGQGGSCFVLAADKFGNFWATIGDTHLYKYVPNGTAGGGTWTNSTPNTNGAVAEFTVDPTSGSSGALRIVASNGDGNISISTNGGGSWTGFSGNGWGASGSQPPWLGNASQLSGGILYLACQGLTFDTSGNLWAAGGIGTWEILSASISNTATWQATSAGIENMVATHVDAPLGNWPVLGVWDRGFFAVVNDDVFPTDYWPDKNNNPTAGPINAGWALDWASSNTNFWTGWVGNDNTLPATTTTGAHAWTLWASTSLGTVNIGGDIAASTASNWIVVPANTSGNLRFTTNGGTSFAAATTTGMTLPISAGEQHGFHMAADRGNANTFCLIDNNDDLWASTNSGSTWTKNSTALEGLAIKYNDALKAVPGNAGVFYYSGGNAGGGSPSKLWKVTKTTNECDTVTLVNSNITNIFGMGFGAALPGGNGFPTIYFWGEYNSVAGLYEIDNGGTTPALINVPTSAQTWPNNSSDFINDVSGDMNVYGRVRVGHNGSSYTYIDTQNACPWVGWTSAFYPTVALTGTVTLQAQSSGLPVATITAVNFYVDGTLIGSQTSGSTSGTPPVTTYSQSWVTGGVATGAHTLKVEATGNGCTTSSGGNTFSIPITTS